MKTRIKKAAALLVALTIVLCSLPAAALESENADRLYTASMFIYSIGRNNLKEGTSLGNRFTDIASVEGDDLEVLEIAVTNGLLQGYEDSTLRPYDNILRVEALVMLSRALGDVDPEGSPIPFSDVPDWAKTDMDNLSAAGIVKGIGDNLLGAEDFITREQVQILSERIDEMLATVDKKDDFYTAVNEKWMRNHTPAPGYIAASATADVDLEAMEEVGRIIETYADAPDSSAQKNTYNFYLSVLDNDIRNSRGIEPLQPYLDMIDDINNTTEAIEAMATIAKELGCYSLLPASVAADLKTPDTIRLYFTAADTGLGAGYLLGEDDEKINVYIDYLTELFTLAGDDDDLETRLEGVVLLQQLLAASSMPYYEYSDIENRYNVYTRNYFESVFNNINLKLYMDTIGAEIPDKFIVEEELQMSYINEVLGTPELILMVRDYIKACLLMDTGFMLSDEFVEAEDEYSENFLTSEGEEDPVDNAIYLTNSIFGEVISVDYLKNNFSDKTSEEVSEIINEIIETYESRIRSAEWMSDATKDKAVEKLEGINIKIGGADSYSDIYASVEMLSPAEGGSLFDNMARIMSYLVAYDYSIIGTPVDHDAWQASAQTVNAFYSPVFNQIVLPAGILQEPLYSPDYSFEKNLGAIGSIIAHEISHAFDSTGALYDKDGNYSNWWTEEDMKNFEKLSDKVDDYYSGIEVIDGIYLNGEYTLNENIADLGAIACITQVAQNYPDFNYEEMYESYAAMWAQVISDENLKTLLLIDDHAPSKIRVNAVLSCCEKFYEIYGITYADDMFVPPASRVELW